MIDQYLSVFMHSLSSTEWHLTLGFLTLWRLLAMLSLMGLVMSAACFMTGQVLQKLKLSPNLMTSKEYQILYNRQWLHKGGV